MRIALSGNNALADWAARNGPSPWSAVLRPGPSAPAVNEPRGDTHSRSSRTTHPIHLSGGGMSSKGNSKQSLGQLIRKPAVIAGGLSLIGAITAATITAGHPPSPVPSFPPGPSTIPTTPQQPPPSPSPAASNQPGPSTIPATPQQPPPPPSSPIFTVYVSCRDTASGPVATVRAVYPTTYAGKPVYFRFNGSPPRQPISSLAQKGSFQKQFSVSPYLHRNGNLDVNLTDSRGKIDLGYAHTNCPGVS